MSKLSFTITLPHDTSSGGLKPQFFLSCNNNTYLSVQGKDIRGARWGNANVNQGYKNRFEYSVTAAKGITKFSLIMNTSTVLPPLSWALASSKSKDKEKKEKKRKNRRDSSKGSDSDTSRSSSKKSETQAKLIGSRFHHHRIHDHPDIELEDLVLSDNSYDPARGKRVHRRDREQRDSERTRDEDRERYRERPRVPPPQLEDSTRRNGRPVREVKLPWPREESSRDTSRQRGHERERRNGDHGHRSRRKRGKA